MFEKVCAWKNVFINLPTQKRAYVIPMSGSQSTIVIWHQVAATMAKNQSLTFRCWHHTK